MSEPVLVIGGAGYIGSHVAKMLNEKGYEVVVLDNLSTGHRWAVKWGDFVEGDAADRELVKSILLERQISSVMHFAAFACVGESLRLPGKYYRNNMAATCALLETMTEVKAGRFIFSSTCATFGEPETIPIDEDHPRNPINPYGRSKLAVEWMLEDFALAHGLGYVNLRYFNAAGADPEGELGEVHDPETHLIPLLLEVAAGERPHIAVFGTDYPTVDGTCVRDYVHVTDLARAHVLALEHLIGGGASNSYNLGIGQGYSVNQVIESVARVTESDIRIVEARRRPGDPATLVASASRAAEELGWKPEFSELDAIVKTAWDWYKRRKEKN